jgi:hypothetical protein
MDDAPKAPAPPVRLPSRRDALLYLCALVILVASVIWGSVTAWEASCPETASAADCRTSWAAAWPFPVVAACGLYLSWLARRTARSLAASGVPIKGPKGMSASMTVQLFMLAGLFIPVALRQLREQRE